MLLFRYIGLNKMSLKFHLFFFFYLFNVNIREFKFIIVAHVVFLLSSAIPRKTGVGNACLEV